MEKEWYVIHTYAGYENKVKANLEKRVESMNMEENIFRVVVPMENEVVIKGGKRKITPRKVYPGYVLVEMNLTDTSWYVVRNTPGVTGFVGTGSKPVPLHKEEAEQILEQLKEGSKTAFPEPPQTKLEVKYVPEAMEEHLSPAFYMIPAIDNSQQNVIYINRARMGNDMTLFTTLAHEGYPGHLYQTIYYESTHPDPIRSLLDFGGYVEGWATYAEMGSYYLMGLSKEQATLLQKNASIILALYALADIGIHYDGWSVEDTEAFFKNYGITDKDAVGEIYKLILGSPANYLKYYIGYVEFLELKKMWVDEKGKDFLQKEFHSAVLKIGPAPFEIVEDYMWKM